MHHPHRNSATSRVPAYRPRSVSRVSSATRLGGALRDALSASAPVFASGRLTGPACVYTTRLATVIVHVDNPGLRGGGLSDLVPARRRVHGSWEPRELGSPTRVLDGGHLH